MKEQREMWFSKCILERKKDAAIHLSLCTRMMVSNHTRSLGASCVSITQSGRTEAIIIKTTGKYTVHHVTDKNKYCLPVYSLTPLSATLSASHSLIMFMCPWQTHVLRMHHTELRSAFDVPLITSSAKPKTFTLWVRGKEIELTSWDILFEYGRKTAIRMNLSGEKLSLLNRQLHKEKVTLYCLYLVL